MEGFAGKKIQRCATPTEKHMNIEEMTETFAQELIEKGIKPQELITAATCLLDKVIQLQKEAKEIKEQKAPKPSHLKMVKNEI